MLGNVIYKKEYLPAPVEDAQEEKPQKLPEAFENLNGMEALMRTLEKTTYILLPERMEGREQFIRESKEAADYHQLDITIQEYNNRISTMLHIDWYAVVSY